MSLVEFHFDFGSPNAYLAHLVIPQIERRTGGKFAYVPVLLGGVFKLTGNRSPAESLAGIKNKPEYERLETERFLKRHGITRYRRNPFFPVNTLAIMRGAVAAQRLCIYERYIDEIYCHMWAEPKKLDDPEVLRGALIEAGFDAGRRKPTRSRMSCAPTRIARSRAARSARRPSLSATTSTSARTGCAMSKKQFFAAALATRE